jgi:O-antigen ligase
LNGAGIAIMDARNSNEFRTQVWDIWLKQQFPQHPVLGRGFGLNSEDMMATVPYTTDEIGGFGATLHSLSKYSRDEAFVVGGHLHHGFYSTVDRFGIVGALCFIFWTFVALKRMFRELLSSRKRPMNPALQWLALYVVVNIIAFPIGALRVENFLPNHLLFCGLFAALYAATYKKAVAEPQTNLQATHSSAIDTANAPVATT